MAATSIFGRFNPFGGATEKQADMPRLDTSAASRITITRSSNPIVADIGADRSMVNGQLTPVSLSSGERSVSPKTPVGQPSSGRSDDYFAPQVASDSPPPQQPGRPGSQERVGDSNGNASQAPSSPKRPNLLQRMNTIAPGPFDSERRPSVAGSLGGRKGSFVDSLNERPGTSASNISFNSTKGAPKAPTKSGYGGFGPPQRAQTDLGEPERLGMPNRSETFPVNGPPARAPSAPGPRPERPRRPSEAARDQLAMTGDQNRRPSRGPDFPRAPPPRTSIVRPRTAGRDGAPVPAINLAEEFGVGNPYHTTSESTSSSVSATSTASSYSPSNRRPSQASSRTSPPRSVASSTRRNPSNSQSLDTLMSDLQSSIDETEQKPSPSMTTQQPVTKQASLKKLKPSPLANRPPPPERGYDPRIDPAKTGARPKIAITPLTSPAAETAALDNSFPPPDRHDISPQTVAPPSPKAVKSPQRTRDRSRPRTEEPPLELSRQPSHPQRPPQSQQSPQPQMQQAPLPQPQQEPVRARSRSGPREPPVPSSRGDCKACGLPITGKSISSADGRLSGRYHKACFVCSTCKESFSSATFYVLDDKPYCDRHYHQLNGSLCGSCDNGIEGQYLEDASAKKHHVGCFRCGDCRMVLRDGYFEVNGKAYCEKDAWRRVQQPWLANNSQNSNNNHNGAPPPRKGPPMGPPRLGLPGGPPSSRLRGPPGPRSPGPGPGPGGPGMGIGMGFPAPPGGNRLGPPQVRPRMEKRMTRLGMMGQ